MESILINATLTLTQDGNILGDENFSLSLEVPTIVGLARGTRQTPVEEAKAIIFREGMNQIFQWNSNIFLRFKGNFNEYFV